MSANARADILLRIAKALDRPDVSIPLSLNDQPADVRQRLRGQYDDQANRFPSHTLPYVADDLVQTLITNMESVQMSVVRLQSACDCIEAVRWYLESEGIDVADEPNAHAVTVAPALAGLAWPDSYGQGAATGYEKVSITPCIAAVAETGSVVMMSGADTPSTLNFLPDTHIVVLPESLIVKHVDDVFDVLREQAVMPRAVNFVTGPSRTADIEQTLEIGAHGPRRMHILLVSGDTSALDSALSKQPI